MKQLGMRLRALREGIGLSQSKFADVIGSTPVSYTHLTISTWSMCPSSKSRFYGRSAARIRR